MLHARVFQTGLVVILAGYLLFTLNKPNAAIPEEVTSRAVLLVPSFENDARGQSQSVFVQQLRASFSNAKLDANAVVSVDAYITDLQAAKLNMKRYNAEAAIVAPRVVITGDKTYLCFSIVVPDTEGTKAYPPTESQIESKILDDIVAMVYPAASAIHGTTNPLANRLQVLEKQVSELQATVLSLSSYRPNDAPKGYAKRIALVVGNDVTSEGNVPQLRYSVADGERTAALLMQRGFEVHTLTNPKSDELWAAFEGIKGSISKDDLFVFYYSGMSFRSRDVDPKAPADALVLTTKDLVLSKPSSHVTLQELASKIVALPNADNLILLDACHGTGGLQVGKDFIAADGVMQILAGSQDDGFSIEDPQVGGGLFTYAFLQQLKAESLGQPVSVLGLSAAITRQMASMPSIQQTPKLVTFGDGDIQL